MTSKIKFVRSSLTKVSYPTTFLNKTKKLSLNRSNEPETYVLTTKDTPIECITGQQDFNYFLAKGCRQNILIDTCQLGFPFTESSLLTSSCYHKGDLEYTIKPGLITRAGGELYTSFLRGTELYLTPPNTNYTYLATGKGSSSVFPSCGLTSYYFPRTIVSVNPLVIYQTTYPYSELYGGCPQFRIKDAITGIDTGDFFSGDASLTLIAAPNQISINAVINENTNNFQLVVYNTGNLFASYSLVAGEGSTNNSSFSIVNNKLQFNGSPNYEVKNQYLVRLKATFSNFVTEQAFIININDLNEAPTAITVAGVPITQPTGATFAPSQTYTSFSVPGVAQDSNGQITFTNPVGGTGSTAGGSSGGFGGGSGGGGAFAASSTFTNQATGAVSYTLLVLETNPNPTVIATLGNNDPDLGTISLYELVQGSGDSDNSLFSITNNALSINVTTDYEIKKEYFIRVKVTTDGGLFTEIPLRVNVVQLAEYPADIILSSNILLSLNQSIGTLTTVDPDNFSTFTYTVSGGNLYNNLSISGNSLVLSSGLDGTQLGHSVIINTTDQTGLSYQKSFNLAFNSLNEILLSAPSNVESTYLTDTVQTTSNLIVTDINDSIQTSPFNYFII
jgi:hypothetical protein